MTASVRTSSDPVYRPSSDAQTADVSIRAYWSPATRFAFRVCFVYFGLYVITTQMLQGMLVIPGLNLPNLGVKPPFLPVAVWFGHHLLGIAKPYDPTPSGSGDRMFDWVQLYTFLTIAVLAATVWSYLARERTNHERLYRWFRVFIRLAVGTSFLTYGFAKIVPLQMPNQLSRLVEPYGNFSMMGVLWASIGSSTAYEAFTGLAEIGAGTLLLIPSTARAGAFVALMDATAIFMLNMTYDVPVKLFAFHLVLMSLFLIAPTASTMWDLFIRNREGRIPPEASLGRTPRARRRVVVAQVVFALYILALQVHADYKAWGRYGPGRPKSPLYGIWDVRVMSVGGVDRPPLLTDSKRFRRAIFDNPQAVGLQLMNDQFQYLRSTFDTTAHTITLVTGMDTTKKSVLTYRRPDRAHLVLDGTLSGRPAHLELQYRNPATFVQRSHGFNLVQNYPYNR